MGIAVAKAFFTKILRVYLSITDAFSIAFDLQTQIPYLNFTVPQKRKQMLT